MALRTAAEYRETVKSRRPAVYLHGERVEDVAAHPATRPVVDATARIFELALDPAHRGVMNAASPLVGEPVSRCVHLCGSREDLHRRADMALLTSQMLGTCNYRCVGCDALHALASTTWEMEQAVGGEYHQRLLAFLRRAQSADLAVSGALTDARGDRSLRPSQQRDPDAYVRIVERRTDGIVVRGAKLHQSGAIAADETLVLPGRALKKGEEDYAVAFALPNGAPGVAYVCQYTAFTAERMMADDPYTLGNPLYGTRETSMVVLDDVFVPWDRVFMAGEVAFAGTMVARFSQMHRMNCGGACKVGFGDLMIGAAQLAAEYTGLAKVPHVVEKIADMVFHNETARACAIAAAEKGGEEPAGSGVFFPNSVFGNIAKLKTAEGFWEQMKLLGDIAGGMAVTMPSERDLDNPATGPYLRKYLRGAGDVSAEERMRLTRFIQNWVAGGHGVGTWHGAGSPETQRMSIYAGANLEEKKRLARALSGLDRV